MIKSIFSICLLLTILNTTTAQIEKQKGKLVKKEWSKTMESYCAGGSAYYVLIEDNQNEILLDLSAWKIKKIEKKLNKIVVLKGLWQSATKVNDDPFSQHPISPVPCRKFVVSK